MTLPPLVPDEIHLYLTFYNEVDHQLQSAYRALLNEAEKQQEMRFFFAPDRLRYLVTRAMVRTVLSRYESVAPEDWVFETNRYGCPRVANAAIVDKLLSFNISHTRNLIVLGVTRRRALGVDVENLVERSVSLNVAKRFFAASEAGDLLAALPDEQQFRFFEYWTLKESYIKARGMGLSIPLEKFSFRFPTDTAVEIAVDPGLNDPARWLFWEFQAYENYLVVVCAERLDNAPEVHVRKIIPLSAEEPADLVLRRRTKLETRG